MQLKITAENANRRLDKFLFAYLNNAPHSFIYRMLRKKRIKLNGARAGGGELLQAGDELRFFLSPETIESCRKTRIIAKAGPLTGIIYEDENLLIVNKPAGLPSHGGMAEFEGGHLLARVLYYLSESGSYDPCADFVPALCNRLDVNTSGLVICGKNLHAIQAVNTLFAGRGIEREYLAVVQGRMGNVGETASVKGFYHKNSRTNTVRILPNASSRENETEVITTYRVEAVSQSHTLLTVKPLTGRSHQIRAHLASIGHPLAGDKKYGGSATSRAPAQLLHCRRLEILIPTILPYPPGTAWEAEPPEGFAACISEWF